jgi:hypothetical protein
MRCRAGHPERETDEVGFVAHLTGELRLWLQDTWARVGVDPDQVTQAVIGCWQDGEVTGLQGDGLGFAEARSLGGPAMPSGRGRLRGRLTARLAGVQRRWLHPPAAADPTTGSGSHCTHRATPEGAVHFRCLEPGRHGGGHSKCPPGSGAAPLLAPHGCPGVARLADTPSMASSRGSGCGLRSKQSRSASAAQHRSCPVPGGYRRAPPSFMPVSGERPNICPV